MNGPIPAQKATLRCRECNTTYNIDTFSTPKEGTRIYPFQTQWHAASNRVYFSTDVHELMCEAGNHAFVSHHAFSEIYNSLFSETHPSTQNFYAWMKTAPVGIIAAESDTDHSEETFSTGADSELESVICMESGRDRDEQSINASVSKPGGCQLAMTRKNVTNAFINGELSSELLEGGNSNSFVFSKDRNRETILKEVDSLIRRKHLYPHSADQCSEHCKTRGCQNLRVIDCCWKICMPHCMFAVENEVKGYPLLTFPNVCTEEPQPNSVFCKQHHQLLVEKKIPTKKEDFLTYIGCKGNPSTTSEIKKVDTEVTKFARSIKSAVGKAVGTSAIAYQGTDTFIEKSDPMVWVDNASKPSCNKDTGEKARLRQRSRGHFICVTGGGHIQCFDPIFKSEGPCQIFMLVIRAMYLELKDVPEENLEKAMEDYILAYDNMCHLDNIKAAKADLPLPEPYNKMWKKIRKVIDRLHLQNHKDDRCKTVYNPSILPDEYNTMVAEQTFSWFSRFKKNANSMTQAHHLFYVHRNIKRRNKYTSKCHQKGVQPLLPGINKLCFKNNNYK